MKGNRSFRDNRSTGREQTPCLKVVWHQPRNVTFDRRSLMGRGILLWLLGVPLPIIILLALFMR
ncbi:hypothetical protein FFR93_36320 [Rhizobium sp. MHM7A]|nr:hypothetical protein FFR93_36320 [Rhizobium sp. MHM7A]